jgi:hypothetical protein
MAIERLTANAKVATALDGFNHKIHRLRGIVGAADEAVLNKVLKKSPFKVWLLLTV